jgi:hypothetical protein
MQNRVFLFPALLSEILGEFCHCLCGSFVFLFIVCLEVVLCSSTNRATQKIAKTMNKHSTARINNNALWSWESG